MLATKGVHSQGRHHAGVDAARKSHDHIGEAALAHIVAHGDDKGAIEVGRPLVIGNRFDLVDATAHKLPRGTRGLLVARVVDVKDRDALLEDGARGNDDAVGVGRETAAGEHHVVVGAHALHEGHPARRLGNQRAQHALAQAEHAQRGRVVTAEGHGRHGKHHVARHVLSARRRRTGNKEQVDAGPGKRNRGAGDAVVLNGRRIGLAATQRTDVSRIAQEELRVCILRVEHVGGHHAGHRRTCRQVVERVDEVELVGTVLDQALRVSARHHRGRKHHEVGLGGQGLARTQEHALNGLRELAWVGIHLCNRYLHRAPLPTLGC